MTTRNGQYPASSMTPATLYLTCPTCGDQTVIMNPAWPLSTTFVCEGCKSRWGIEMVASGAIRFTPIHTPQEPNDADAPAP